MCGTDQPCCPGNICDITSPLNACFYNIPDVRSERFCKPIIPTNVNFHLYYGQFQSLTNDINIGVDKNEFGIFRIAFGISSDILLQRSQNLTQSGNNLLKIG